MTSRSSKQHGFMSVMLLILLGLFLTFAAFAIDLGNMYLWQLRLDKAARAGALAGLGARGLSGWTVANSGTGVIENAARTAVIDNLLTYGFTRSASGDPEGFTISSFFTPSDDQMAVTVRYTMPTILVGRIKAALGYGFNEGTDEQGRRIGGATSLNMFSTQYSQLSRANVVLMLDVSGSMLCPVNDPPGYSDPRPCACRRDADPNACQISAANPTKLAQMAQGVVNFVSQFNPNQDRISVIPFNLAARRLFSFTTYRNDNGIGSTLYATPYTLTLTNAILNPDGSEAVAAGTSQWDMLTNVNTLTAGLTALAGSNTNHCDALAEGIRELETLSADVLGTGLGEESDRRKLQPFVVFFTDGAPNAMRGIFPDAPQQAGGPQIGRDYYHYALEWVVPNPVVGQPPFTYRGPGPFVLRTDDSTNPATNQPLFRFPIAASSVAPAGSTTCGQPQSTFFAFEQTITQNTSPARGGPNGCLSNTTTTFNFAIPNTDFDAQGNQLAGNYQAQVLNVPISTAATSWRDPNWPSTHVAPVPYGVQKYDELPYYCAIEAADYLRLHFGATIFAIGLGPTNAHSSTGNANEANCNDPLMDADDHSGRKDFFLSRLALSRQIYTNPLLPISINNHYRINVPQTTRTVTNCVRHRFRALGPLAAPALRVGYTSPSPIDSSVNNAKQDNFADSFKALRPFRPPAMDPLNNGIAGANYRRIDTQGEYFPTNDPNQVPSIFSNIAKIILLRSTT